MEIGLHLSPKSPVLKSIKRSHRNSPNTCSYEGNTSASTSTTSEQRCSQQSTVSTSKNDTQDSNLTTQHTQSFKTRLEKKFLQISFSSPSTVSNTSEPDVDQNDLETSVECISSSFVDLGPFFGLPSKAKELIFQHRRIKGLYEWQESCLKAGLQSKNLLISLPTSSGKTLVAEVLMLRKVLLYRKDSLFVLPYISLVQEKVRDLCSLAVDLNFTVDEYAAGKGFYPPKVRKKRNTIYVATIEKANSLIESMLENNRMSELGLVVVDEIHMLSETGGRGAKLESAVTKLKHFAKEIQLVCMSATVGNLEELASFLNATLYQGGFRPVTLTQYIKVEDDIAVINPKARSEEDLFEKCLPTKTKDPPKKSSSKLSNSSKLDCDKLTPLVEEIIPKHSCLVFCPSKNNTQAVALMLCTCLPKALLQHRMENKVSLLSALKEEGSGLICSVLRKTIPFGIGYHNSGLTEGERKLLEEAFIMGTLCCIVSTSTLAAGVNLPARRVIIRAPYVGKDFITRSRYNQMIGRAGRAGLDSVGESYVMVNPRDVLKVKELLLSSNEKCISKLASNEAKGLTDLLFSMLGIQMIKSIAASNSLAQDTLLAFQAHALGIDVNSEVMRVLEYLRTLGLLRTQNDTKVELASPEDLKNEAPSRVKLKDSDRIIVCRVGRAAVKGSVDLRWANRLYYDLVNARGNLAVHSHLHLLYLVTPYDSADTFECNPVTFLRIYGKLTAEESEIAVMLGVTDAIAVKISMGKKPKEIDQRVIQRFYVALLLHKLLSGENIWDVSETFHVHRGLIQQLLNSTVSFAYSVSYFCEELQELWAFRDLLASFTKTLSICSYSEITDLLTLPAVKFGRAKLLYKAGFKDLAEIARTNPQELVKKVEHLPLRIASQIINSAKMLLLEKANALQEEAEEMLSSFVV